MNRLLWLKKNCYLKHFVYSHCPGMVSRVAYKRLKKLQTTPKEQVISYLAGILIECRIYFIFSFFSFFFFTYERVHKSRRSKGQVKKYFHSVFGFLHLFVGATLPLVPMQFPQRFSDSSKHQLNYSR